MKKLAILFVLATVTACASSAGLKRKIPLLEGRPVSDAIAAFGSTFNKEETPDGIRYFWIRRIGGGGYAFSTGAMYVEGSTSTTECMLFVDTDAQDTILRTGFSGQEGACSSFDYSLRSFLNK